MGVYIGGDVEGMLEYWLQEDRLGRARWEHKTPANLMANLTQELELLCMSFAAKVGFRSYEEQRPVPQGGRRGRGDKTRGKTILEQLSDTDESSDEEEPPSSAPLADSGHEAMEGFQQSGEERNVVDAPTERWLKQHVQEFLRERLHPPKRVKDALAWWAANEQWWPMVAAIARHSLCVPAAAACSERGFSATGHLVRARRARLSDDRIEQLSHLTHNLEFE